MCLHTYLVPAVLKNMATSIRPDFTQLSRVSNDITFSSSHVLDNHRPVRVHLIWKLFQKLNFFFFLLFTVFVLESGIFQPHTIIFIIISHALNMPDDIFTTFQEPAPPPIISDWTIRILSRYTIIHHTNRHGVSMY